MTTKYFAILTNQGAARLANATALGTKLNITQMAVGDGGGTLPTPDPAQTKLVNQTRIAPINSLGVAANDAGQIIAEQIIPENEGGFFIREIGLYDDDGVLIAVANCPETYKPLLAEGSGRTQTIRMILVVSSTSAITLKIDPSVVLATRKYVDDAVIEVKSYVDKQVKAHEAKANPHSQYLLIKSALKEIADAGLVDKVLENLGLGAGCFPVGMPFLWGSETPPNLLLPEWSNVVFLKFNGASFSGTTYPKLAKVFPSLVLPDARGAFPRIWDDGRGVDPGRALLTEQGDAIRNISGFVDVLYGQVGGNRTGPFFNSNVPPQRYYTTLGGSGVDSYISMGFDAGRVVPVANENRPINMSFNLFVRAA